MQSASTALAASRRKRASGMREASGRTPPTATRALLSTLPASTAPNVVVRMEMSAAPQGAMKSTEQQQFVYARATTPGSPR